MKPQAEFYVLKFEIAKAEAVYDQMLKLDIHNLTILQTVAGFYREERCYEKALYCAMRS